jgi:predicted dehydrogenase
VTTEPSPGVTTEPSPGLTTEPSPGVTTEPPPAAADPIRWGIVATGGIATTMAQDLGDVADAVKLAVASRTADRAQAFAKRHGFERAYGSYAEIIADPDVDILYIATPHRQHHAIACAAVEAGKAVLVEKAFTVTLAGAREVLERARQHGVFAMEAMWTRHLPLVRHVRALVEDGAIGEVRSVRADLGFVGDTDRTNRFWDPLQGGGAMLDVGVYTVALAQLFLGEPVQVTASGRLADTGVDEDAGLLLEYASGARALLESSLIAPVAGGASILGTLGRIDIPPRFHHPSTAVLHRGGADPEVVRAEGDLAMIGHGFAHQVLESHRCIRGGALESPVMPWADTLSVMQTMEMALHALGYVSTEDDTVFQAP